MVDANQGGAAQPRRRLRLPETLSEWQTALLFGFLGGTIPPLLKLASACLGNEEVDMPRLSFWAAVLFLGIVGATVSSAFHQHTKREAFIAGIIAPSLVANLIGGYGEGTIRRSIKVGEIGQIVTSALVTPAQADSLPPNGIPYITLKRRRDENAIVLDFEWDIARKNVLVEKVRFEFFKSALPEDEEKETLLVSPDYGGQIVVPHEFKYVSVDGGDRTKIPSGDSFILIHADVRTSATRDFMWGLGAPRFYKLTGTKAEFLPLAGMIQK
jgi:hypothetical protein